MNYLCALVVLLFSSARAAAGLVDVQTVRYQATDPMDMSSTRLSFVAKPVRGPVGQYGVGTEVNEGLSRELRYHGLKGTGHVRLDFTPATSLTVTSGVNRLANEYGSPRIVDEAGLLLGEDQIIPVYSGSLRVASRAWIAQGEVAHDYVYQDWSQPRAATGLLNGTKYGVSGDAAASDRWRLRGTAAWTQLNDGNLQRVGEVAVMVDLLNRRDRVRAGVGVWYDDIDRPESRYWTPRDFTLSTLRTETELRLDPDLTMGLKANVGYGGEHVTAKDVMYALDAKLEYRFRADWRVSVGCGHMELIHPRGGTYWTRNDLSANLATQL